MSEQRNKPPQAQVPQFRKDIRQKALRNIAKLLSDYYQQIKQEINQDELKNETFEIVKKMDQVSSQSTTGTLNEQEYTSKMSNQFKMYQQHFISKMMATIMINNLKKIQEFTKNNYAEFLPQDYQLINRLIQFIESIPSDKNGALITNPDQSKFVKQYYDTLFIPIQKKMEDQMNQSSQGQLTPNPSQQQMMQAQGMPTIPSQMQQMQRLQITPSMSQQIPTQNQQDLSSIPRQMPVPTIPEGMAGPMQIQQPNQDQQIPGQPFQMQPQAQAQQSQAQLQQMQQMQQQMQQQIQQQQSVQNLQQIQQQQSVQNLQQQNPRSPQQKPRSPRSMSTTPPQMMQQKQQQMQGMNLPVNAMQQPQQLQQPNPQPQQMPGRPQMPNSASGTDLIKQLFQSVRADCAVFYSTPHPPHF